MSEIHHPLLKRQLKKLSLSETTGPDLASWKSFLQRVDTAYIQEDQGRYLLERSLTLSSQELRELNESLQKSSLQLAEDKAKLERWQWFHQQLIKFIADALYYGFDSQFYTRLLGFALEIFNLAEAGSILARNQAGQFEFVAARGFDLEALKPIVLSSQEMLIGDSTRPCIIDRKAGVTSQQPSQENQAKLRFAGRVAELKSTLFIPVFFEEDLIASINLDTVSKSIFLDAETEAMAQVFSAQVAILLQRFKLSGELEASNHRLERLANYDTLTGLANRSAFIRHVSQVIGKQGEAQKNLALLFIDLDGFKLVNDSLGHLIGDQLLVFVASRLEACVRRSDMVARLGGDEFTISLENLANPEMAVVVAEKVLQSFHSPFVLEEQEFKISASIGIAYYPSHAGEVHSLIKLADIAMYQAKGLGKNRYFVFSEELNHSVGEKMHLLQEMRKALTEDAFELYYQPRISLHTNEVTSAEVLLRWHHPERGFISPGVIIPLAEESGLIHALGDWVRDKVCQQLKVWQNQGKELRLALNVSVQELQANGFVKKVIADLERYQVNPDLIELEITESAAMFNVEVNIEKLKRLQAYGIRLAIDDFGTAYSSLNYLKRLPVHCLKIDRSFVMDIDEHDSVNQAIIRSIIALAKSMELEVVAEGVETLPQLEFLKAHDCTEGQGYFFSRPVPLQQLESQFLGTVLVSH